MKAQKEKRQKHRKRFRIILELIFMTLGIICTIMPYPFPLLVPISIGTIRIIGNAIRSEKEPPPAQPVVYCNGNKELHKEVKNQSRKNKPQ